MTTTTGRTQFRWPTASLETAWFVTATWGQDDDGSVGLSELHIEGQGRPVTTKLLRDLGPELERRRKDHVARLGAATDAVGEEVRLRAAKLNHEVLVEGRQLRGRMDFDKVVEVATVYAKAHDRGQAATQAVADRFGVPRGTASSWVRTARRWGLLDPAAGPMARGVTVRETLTRRAEIGMAATESEGV